MRRPDGTQSLLVFGEFSTSSHTYALEALVVEPDGSGEPVLAWQGCIDDCSIERPCRRRPPTVQYLDADRDGDLDLRVHPVLVWNGAGPPTFLRDAAGKLESGQPTCALD